jgi:hypothetical protein
MDGTIIVNCDWFLSEEEFKKISSLFVPAGGQLGLTTKVVAEIAPSSRLIAIDRSQVGQWVKRN